MSTGALRWLLVLVAGAACTGGAMAAPRGLRKMASFRVENVELVGARYLTLADAVAATGITPTSTLFDDFGPWRSALLRHPLVLEAVISRRLPGTIVLQVRETRPIAFARLSELQPVDARGRILALDVVRTPLDLPVLEGTPTTSGERELTDARSLRALRALGRVAELEPVLYAMTSEVAGLPDGVRLTLRQPRGAELLLPAWPQAADLHLLRLALADIDRMPADTAAAPARSHLRRIDARYGEQVVVALNPSESR